MRNREPSRREFLSRSARLTAGVAAGTWALNRPARAQANEKIVIGVMGTGGRGQWLLDQELLKRPNIEIAYLCDVDQGRLAEAMAKVEKATGQKPKPVEDYHAILEDKAVDAFFNVTPDHWHALPTIEACQAHKDVYVEKPASHNLWEGRQMVAAARKYERIVQLGTQTRSGAYTKAAVEFLRSGRIGKVHFVRVLNMKHRPSIGHAEDCEPPQGVNYDRWLGPAPKRPFNPNRFHYKWHWNWDYSGGDIINDGVHQIDVARLLIDRPWPKAVSSSGGRFAYDDDQQTPDTQLATWEYDKLVMSFDLTLWTPHMQKTPWEFRDTDGFPDWRFNATQVQLHGTEGVMYFSRHGGGWQAFDPEGKEVASHPGRHPHPAHLDNFFACMKSREKPNADIEEGHLSTVLCHVANISYRLGGRRLVYDGQAERFPGDEEANKLLKRAGRSPYRIPEQI